MKVYLAGPMSGIPYFNFPAFHAAAAKLRAEGHIVFNPAEQDCKRYGTDISANNLTGSIDQAVRDHNFSLREALAEDTSYICREADAVALLPSWEKSSGARAEWALALPLRLGIIYL